eukprot:TRINITY_DN30051_c0_g1_i1.p1 TRINITY_DN30051_c0_g1~~TRINITY_DN30051_c0_g1_i1.p1  ORF type:complete len:574 (+),score=105.45 TRINITY_DN30051_c0_g1_i1:172-1893(+)
MGSSSSQHWEELGHQIKQNDEQAIATFLERLAAAKAGRCAPGVDRKTMKLLQAMNLNEACAEGQWNGRTALQFAAARGSLGVLRRLLQAGPPTVDINARNSTQNTALHYAAAAQLPTCVQSVHTLLENGAVPLIANANGLTPLAQAQQFKCTQCVRALEQRLHVWQGWVDVDRPVMFMPKWTPCWLVVHRDRLPNSGPSATAMRAVTCYKCARVIELPMFKSAVRCSHCGEENTVAATLQVAMYDAEGSQPQSGPSSSPMPTATISLPQDASWIEAKAVEDASLTNAISNLLQGKLKRSLRSTVGSQREFGLSLRVKDAQGSTVVEQGIRVASEEDRNRLLAIFRDPVVASYNAAVAPPSIAVVQATPVQRPPPPPPPPAPATAPQEAAAASAAPAAGSGSDSGGGGRWACHRCTYVHLGEEAKLRKCLICETAQAEDNAPPSSAPPPGKLPPEEPSTTAASSSSNSAAAEPPSAPTSAQAAPAPPTATVQAFLGAAPSTPSTSNAPTSTGAAAEDDDGMCVVCLERPADTAVVPCGHMCGCGQCLQAIQGTPAAQCPLCRGPVTSVIKIFRN